MSKEILDQYDWIVTTSSKNHTYTKCKQGSSGIALIRNSVVKRTHECLEELSVLGSGSLDELPDSIRYKISKDSNIVKFLNKIEDAYNGNTDFYYIKNIALHAISEIEDAKGYLNNTKDLVIGASEFCPNKKYLLTELLGSGEALTFYNKMLQDDPYNLDAITNKAFLLHALGRDKEAIMCFDNELYLGHDRSSFYCNQGGLLAITGNFQQAIESYSEALRLILNQADQVNAISCIAYLSHKLGRLKEAMTYFTIAESFTITDIYFYYYKGNFLRDIGQ